MNLFEDVKEKGRSVKRRAEGTVESQRLFLGEGGTGFEDPIEESKKRRREKLDDDEELELTADERVTEQEFGELFRF